MAKIYKVGLVVCALMFVLLFLQQHILGDLWYEGWTLWTGLTAFILGSALTECSINK
jgi:hypothetical protein